MFILIPLVVYIFLLIYYKCTVFYISIYLNEIWESYFVHFVKINLSFNPRRSAYTPFTPQVTINIFSVWRKFTIRLTKSLFLFWLVHGTCVTISAKKSAKTTRAIMCRIVVLTPLVRRWRPSNAATRQNYMAEISNTCKD